MDYYLISLCVIIVVVFFVLIWQIIAINASIENINLGSLNDYVIDPFIKGYPGLYSIIVDCPSTLRMNDLNRLHYDELRSLITEEEHMFVIPNTCDDNKIKLSKIGFLVCKPSIGSDNLSHDINGDFVKYIILNGFVFVIRKNDSVTSKVQEVLDENVHVYVLFSLMTVHDCKINIVPFYGSIILNDSRDTLNIDMEYNLGIKSSQKTLPIQALSYSIQK